MMKIEHCASSPDRAGRYTVRLDNGSSLRLYSQTVEDFSLCSGLELTDAEYDKLLDAAGKMSAKMRAIRIVAATSVSKKELQQRLIYKGEKPEDAELAVMWMQDLHLIDDLSTAQTLVNRCIGKGYGVARARQVLYEKRIPKVYWDSVLEDYPEQNEAILNFLRSHLGNSREEKEVRRVTNALLRRGHSYQEIRRGLESLSVDDDFLEE